MKRAAVLTLVAMIVLLESALVFGAKAADAPGVTTIYIRNLSPRFISDKTIRNDIPAWESAVNGAFADAWHTTQFRLVFLGRNQAPTGGIVATFVDKGPIQGALAYHTVDAGVPGIVVYAGTGAYYGYNNSVSFTHELFEMAADPTISMTNQGWPADWMILVTATGIHRVPIQEGTVWAQEVCDPVEEAWYTLPGANGKPVEISDYITPNWFNDGVNGGYDEMNLVQQPLTILRGGYAQYWDGLTWNLVANWRHLRHVPAEKTKDVFWADV